MTLNAGEEKDLLALLGESEGRAELHFKPLTTGLGFEHPGEKKAELIKKKALRRQFRVGRANPLQVSPVPRGELAPFYDDNSAPPTPQVVTKLTPPYIPPPRLPRKSGGGQSRPLPQAPSLQSQPFGYLPT